jgi:two-component system phosphate regulon sensor histidine kinase PhoR
MVLTNLSRQRYLETVRRDFVSNISHELRTPLASLKALTETLQSGALDDPPAAQRFLQRMETEVDALTQMVAELLELSRIESGRVPMEMRQTRAQDIITSSVDRLRMQAERARLKLIIDLPEDLPEISADPARLEQVMVNLLHNAIKFTPPGGEICIRARTTVDESTQKPVLIFSVQDTGVGIPADMLPRIFERFYKGDRARSGGGTGLGLAIARHTVEAHQGKIWAESETGKGSTFYFSIPIS